MPAPLLGAFLVASIGSLVKRALVAVGIGTVTYVGLNEALVAVKQEILANYGQISAPVVGILELAGFNQCVGIILGAITARVGLAVLSKFAKVL